MFSIMGAAKYYKQTTALNGLSFSLDKGDVVGLFGENGAGKTTLLKALMGLCSLNSGYVTLDGTPLTAKSYERLSFITEEGSFFPNMTPLAHGEFYDGMFPCFKTDRFLKLLEFFELPEKKAHALSRGQRMKLDIAVGMSRGADFILMDEPFLGKDIFTRRDFLQLMITMLEPDEGVVIATHQIKEIEMFITRAVVMKEGKIVADEPLDVLSAKGENLLSLIGRVCEYDEKRVMRFME